jgi:hypothetical protein
MCGKGVAKQKTAGKNLVVVQKKKRIAKHITGRGGWIFEEDRFLREKRPRFWL